MLGIEGKGAMEKKMEKKYRIHAHERSYPSSMGNGNGLCPNHRIDSTS